MFAGFLLDLGENKRIDFSPYRSVGTQHLNNQKASIETELKQFVINESDGQTIDGTLLTSHWFPQVEADVFLSHSHKDLPLVEGVAGWLYQEFGLRCFIDSNVWGYSDSLLEILNSRYSNKRPDGDGGYLYDHIRCVEASKHVNIMLSIALQRMIDKTEAVFLVSTDNAIRRYDATTNSNTYSPWIYSEIVCSDIVRKKPLSDYRTFSWFEKRLDEQFALEHQAADNETLRVAYEVSTDHLIELSEFDLLYWQMLHHKDSYLYPLDMLYVNKLKDCVQELKDAYCNPNNKQLLCRR